MSNEMESDEALASGDDTVHVHGPAPDPSPVELLAPWSESEDVRLRAALADFIEATIPAWRDPEFARWIYIPESTKTEVNTTAESEDVARLSKTGRLLRGHVGVKVDVNSVRITPSKNAASQWILHALSSTGVPLGNASDVPLNEVWQRLVNARDLAKSAVLETSVLNLCVMRSVGRRIDTDEEILENIRNSTRGTFYEFCAQIALQEAFRAGAASLGVVTSDDCQIFNAVGHLTQEMMKWLVTFARRERYTYESLAYLNGPALDTDEQLEIFGKLTCGDVDSECIHVTRVVLIPASDELIAHAATAAPYGGAKLPTGVERCNTIIKLELSLAVEASPSRYYDLYPISVHVAERVLEALRVTRPEDIGISYIAIRAIEAGTPWAATEEWAVAGSRAPDWTPRRPTYAPVSLTPLSDTEARRVVALAPSMMWPPQVRGLPIARRRLRDAYERYPVDDAERLLEYAIALEAMVLNDQQSKSELGFRAAIRTARLLGETIEERIAIASTVRHLYDLRSRLAHGETLQTLKAKDAKKLTACLEDAPHVIRRLVQYMLLSDKAPVRLEGEPLIEWWRRIELA